MATILSDGAVSKIRNLQKKFKPYADRGWMSEGSDAIPGAVSAIFNNNTEEFFICDIDGNIISGLSNLTSITEDEAKEMAKIEGMIRKTIEEN